jgi:hypothetical protein
MNETNIYVQCFGKWQGGLGDFVRSWFCTFVYARIHLENVRVKLYIPDHPLKFCLEHLMTKEEEKKVKTLQTLTITTHNYNEKEICDIFSKRCSSSEQSFILISNLRFLGKEIGKISFLT